MKKLLVVTLFFTLLVGFTTVTSAASWRIIQRANHDLTDRYFDMLSFRKTSPQSYTVQIRTDYDKSRGQAESNKLGFKYPVGRVINKMEFNFSSQQYRILSANYFDEGGALLSSSNAAGTWNSNSASPYDRIFNDTYKHYKNHYQ